MISIRNRSRGSRNAALEISELYTTKATCLNGVNCLQTNCIGEIEDQTAENVEVKKHPKFELYADKADEFRFRLKA